MRKKHVKTANNLKIHTIDATNKVLGRLSTEIVNLLRGKNKPTFDYRGMFGDKVLVINARKMIITGRKLDNKVYWHHSGYLGGMKSYSMKEIFTNNPEIILFKSVYRMLPNNKLRKLWLKNLTIYADNPKEVNIKEKI